MKTVIINGSPNKDGVIGSLLKEIVELSSEKDSLVHLRDYQINPCKGCNFCTKSNICIQKDDWSKISTSLADAELLVIGFPTYYGGAFGVNALTHTFLERWYCLRHNGLKIKARKAILVVSSGENQENLGIQAVKTFLEAYHGIEVVDYVTAIGATPCYICGYGESCVMSAARARHGAELKITDDLIPCIKKQPQTISKAKEVGLKIKQEYYK